MTRFRDYACKKQKRLRSQPVSLKTDITAFMTENRLQADSRLQDIQTLYVQMSVENRCQLEISVFTDASVPFHARG
jgi:hypothetical protein